jgi:hypothetical protein
VKHALDHYILHQATFHESFPMTGQELKVYLQLLSSANDKTLQMFVGTPTMAEYTGLDRRSVQRVFDSLLQKGAIKPHGKENGTNKYRLVFPPSIPFTNEAKGDAVHEAKGVAKDVAMGVAKGDARVRHGKSSSPQVATQKGESEKEDEKEDEKELDQEQIFLGSYGHVIEFALKKYLHLLPPELCSPLFVDDARRALTDKLRTQHSVTPLPLCIKGHARSEQVAEQLADDFTAEQHPQGCTLKPHDIHKLLAHTFKTIPNE